MERNQKLKNMREYQDRITNEFNEEFVSLQKVWKKNERRLAPLMFPALVKEQRARDGLHMSQISTPISSRQLDMLSSRGHQRISRMSRGLDGSRLEGRSHASRGKLVTGGISQRQVGTGQVQRDSGKKVSEMKLPALPVNNDYFGSASQGLNTKL